jgi:membrane dipeptidase
MIVVSAEARAIHRAALIVDLHCDLLLPTFFFGWDWNRRHRANPLPGAAFFGHCDLPRLQEGNLGCLALGVVVNPWWGGPDHIRGDLARMAQAAARSCGGLTLAGDADAIRTAHAAGKVACFAGLEGAHALRGGLDDLAGLRAEGLRYVGLVHFTANEACRPMVGWGARAEAGLTNFGRDLVDELGRQHILVDLAHASRGAVRETCARVRVPLICSHTACNAVHASPRGLDDAEIRLIADTGGVVGVIFVTPFIGPGGARQAARHLDHLRRLVGVEACALGSDWEGFSFYPSDLSSAEKLPNLTQALLELGWSAEDIHAAYGGNVLRVIAEACG